jgi:serine/threonine protein phosphatase PrpC
MHWNSGAVSDQGRVRKVNQDAFLDRPDLGIWAVADGMGGHTDGAIASSALVEGLGSLANPRLLGSGARLMERTLKSVNRQLLDRAQQTAAGDLIGSTIVSLLAVGDHCVLLWVGDSRIYRLRDGRLQQLTTDHSQVQVMVDEGLLHPDLAENHPLSNVLLRAVGSDEPMPIDRRIERLRDGDRYLLCSDGLFRELDSDAIATNLAASPPAEAARALVQQACDHGARDNVTAVAVQFSE